MKICPICAEEIEVLSAMYGGHEVHPRCAEYAGRPETALDYASAWPGDFFDYLRELLVCTDCPELTAGLKALLADFRDHWGARKPFEDWICDNEAC